MTIILFHGLGSSVKGLYYIYDGKLYNKNDFIKLLEKITNLPEDVVSYIYTFVKNDIKFNLSFYKTLFTKYIYDFSNNYVNNNLVTIDSDGIIYFELGIDVGRHTFIINYNLNFVDNQTIYNINILPIINYDQDTIYLLYERLITTSSLPPYYQQPNGYFIIQDYIGDMVANKYVRIDISSGIIYFNDYI